MMRIEKKCAHTHKRGDSALRDSTFSSTFQFYIQTILHLILTLEQSTIAENLETPKTEKHHKNTKKSVYGTT